MKILPELAKLLLGEHAMVMMESNKTMIALYWTFGLQFLHAEHIHGHYGHVPDYICKSWITLDEHGLSTFLDQVYVAYGAHIIGAVAVLALPEVVCDCLGI